MKQIIFPPDYSGSLAFYLAMEDYVAEKFDEDVFFVWQSRPTVIIGRNQDLEAEVNVDFCKSHGIDIVRRRSGGGCVYSDAGNIMISYISRRGDVAVVFERYISMLTDCLRSIGLDAQKSGRNDVLVDGLKVSGNAFRQMPGRSIVHGTLLFSTDFDILECAIMPPVEKLERHGIKSVRQRVGNISGLCPSGWDVERLKQYIVSYFTQGGICLGPDDMKAVEARVNEVATVLYSAM